MIESNENLTLTITRQNDALYKLAGDASSITAQGTIVDDDTAAPTPVVSVSNVVVEEDVDPAVMTFTVELSEMAAADVDFTYLTSDGTAEAGSDYTEITSTPLSITAGETSEEFSISITDDNIDEFHETFNVALTLTSTNAEFAGGGTSYTAIGTIRDDDRKAMLEFQDTAVATHEGAGTMEFVVNVVDFDTGQQMTSGKPITVGYSIMNGTTEDADYTLAVPPTLTIPTGTRSGTIRVTLTSDVDTEDETFTLILADPDNAILGIQSHQAATGTITDSGTPVIPSVPVISISSSAEMTGVTEGYTFDFEVESDRDLGGTPLDVEFTVTDGSTGATITGTTVQILGDERTATGTVTSIGNVPSATDIVIAINDTTNYNVSTSDPSITVAVKDNDALSTANPGMK